MNKPTTQMTPLSPFERKLAVASLLAPRIDGDYLVLADATLAAAIDGSHPLSAGERAALAASPLTLRRFRALVEQGRALAQNRWQGSAGMLRAADSGAPLLTLETDDGHWRLHFIAQDGQWRMVLQLDAAAPFAASLLGEAGAMLEVRDGAGTVLLQGALDADGECEQAWPLADDPAPHLQRSGAGFRVMRANELS